MIKARNTIRAYSIPDFRNRLVYGKVMEMNPQPVCEKSKRLTDISAPSVRSWTKLQAKITDRYADV